MAKFKGLKTTYYQFFLELIVRRKNSHKVSLSKNKFKYNSWAVSYALSYWFIN